VKKRILFIAILLGLLTATVLYIYLEDMKETPAAVVNLKDVVVAVSSIPAHVKLTPEMLTVKSLPAEGVHPEAFTTIAEAVGGTTKSGIVNGEQLIRERVVTNNVGSPLAYRIPENMRAMTIPLTEISGVAGYIMPGDRIDILVTYTDETINPVKVTFTQFQNIEVLEKGPYTVNQEEKQLGVSSSITLLVNPQQAEVLAYANTSGALHFTLRNPLDTTKNDVQQFDSANFNTWRDR
jgi:pilus assembly protein CpaB